MKRVINGRIKQFDVEIENRVGALADVCDIFAKGLINIKAIATADRGNGYGMLQVVTEDENTTRKILKEANIEFKEHDILSLKLMDRPGELAKTARLLAKGNVNIESIFILGKNNEFTEVGMKVDKIHEVKNLLE